MADVASIIEFLEVPVAASFDVAPERAIDYFRHKGLRPTFSYAEMLDEAHDHAFTVAKMMDVDLLAQVRNSLDNALANGIPFRDWADDLMPMLQRSGWWGKKEVVDPQAGEPVAARLGSASRLETIFRTNMQSAYAAGAWQEIEAQADIAPYLMYDAIDDFRTRPLHHSWDNTVLPAGDAWWGSHYPPNGWNCRCGVIQLSEGEVESLGLRVSKSAPKNGEYTWTNPRTGEKERVPNGIDPGFDHNAGKSYLADLRALLADKIGALPEDMQAAGARVQAAVEEQAKTQVAIAAGIQRTANAEAQASALDKAKQLIAAKLADLAKKKKKK